MIGWNFPSNNYGTESGLNDAGIETFKGKPLISLSREIIQNSSDAKNKDNNLPVKVSFKLKYIEKNCFPNINEFNLILKKCKDHWSHNRKAVDFFNKAISVVEKDKIPVLKISDYNTTGLTGSKIDRRQKSNWFDLVVREGSSHKGSTSGGSFGIGKNAPFACSALRTVFYGTKDVNNSTAFQGVAKLVTHEKEKNITTQGRGYFGVIDKNLPITDYRQVDPFFLRQEFGTDVFIAGFNEVQSWQTTIIKSVLEDFFVAIYKGNLIVEVENTLIDSNNLHELFQVHFKEDKNNNSVKFFETLITTDPIIENIKDINGDDLGSVELFIKSQKNYPKRVGMVRSTGMKIFDKGHFRTPLKFAGVFIANGSKLNQFLRLIENPAHDKWEVDRHEDKSYAHKTLSKIYKWINEQVKGLADELKVEEIDVEGMSQFLPDEEQDIPINEDTDKNEGEKSTPNPVELEIVDRKSTFHQTTTREGEQTHASNDSGENTWEFSPGEDSNDEKGGLGLPRDLGTDEGEALGSKKGLKNEQLLPNKTPIKIMEKRIFCFNPSKGLYRVVIQTNKDGIGFLKFQIVGEESNEQAEIADVTEADSGSTIKINQGNKVGPIDFIEGQKQTYNIRLKESSRYALEVLLYEN